MTAQTRIWMLTVLVSLYLSGSTAQFAKLMWRVVLRLLLGGMAGFVIAACGSDQPLQADSTTQAYAQVPGVHRQTLSGLLYTIAIPPGYTGNQPAPLILALHFGGEVTPFYGGAFLDVLVGPALGDVGAILLAPDAAAGSWSNAQSEANVIALLDTIQNHYNIDTTRTLVTGFSMGGRGTWYMAARHQNRFAAAIPIAARPESDSGEIEWRIPLYIIHSRQDEVVPLEPVETVVGQLKARGVSVELVVVEGITHFETSRFIGPLRAAIPWIQNVWK